MKEIEKGDSITMEDAFLGRYAESFHINPYLGHTLRAKIHILDCRELLRIKSILKENPKMISRNNFVNDDVIRALSLSGSFGTLEDDVFVSTFSGMLVPGQPRGDTYNVHSCIHGFEDLKLDDVYFLPYGIDDQEKTIFKVKTLWKNSSEKIPYTSADIDKMSETKSFGNQNDYGMIKIEGLSCNGENLHEVLKQRDEEFYKPFPEIEQDAQLTDFIGTSAIYDEKFEKFGLENSSSLSKYFLIGQPGDPRFALGDEGFAIVTNLTNHPYVSQPIRLINNDDINLENPLAVGSFNEFASDFACYPGMSGGIVLQCLVVIEEGITKRICRAVGTCFGAEKQFDENKIARTLSSYVNIIPTKN